jgi:hypothetical protein
VKERRTQNRRAKTALERDQQAAHEEALQVAQQASHVAQQAANAALLEVAQLRQQQVALVYGTQ